MLAKLSRRSFFCLFWSLVNEGDMVIGVLPLVWLNRAAERGARPECFEAALHAERLGLDGI